MSKALSINEFLEQPAPREDADRFLTAAHVRLGGARKAFQIIFGGTGAFMVLIALAVSMTGKPTLLAALQMVVGCWIGILVMVALPCWIYVRQDVSLGRKLLQQGAVAAARVTDAMTTPNGGTVVKVTSEIDGASVQLAFRVPKAVDAAKSLIGSDLSLLCLDGGKTVGLWMNDEGLVTTR